MKLNAEREGKALAQKYGVSGFPTLLYLDADGGEWGRVSGFVPAPGFLQIAGDAIKSYKEQPLLEAKLKQNPRDFALAADLTERLARQGNEKKALWAASLMEKGPRSGKWASACGALGRHYLKKQSGSAARTWFQRSLTAATEARDKAYAHFGLAFCFLGERNAKGARAELNAALQVPGCPRGIQDNARKILEQLPN